MLISTAVLFHLNRNASIPSHFFLLILDRCQSDCSLYFDNGKFHNFLIMLASEAAQSQSVKRISSNTRVSGAFWSLNDDVDKRMNKVQFDDGSCQDVYKNRLCVKSHFASLLSDAIPPLIQDDPDRPPQGD